MAVVEPIRKFNDIKKVESILFKQNIRDFMFFVIGINCGLRISDILALDVKDVKNKKYIQLKEKKTGKFKKIPLNSKLKPLINKYTKRLNLNEPLFKSSSGERMNRFEAYKIINKACCLAGLNENIGTHSLRKTFGYHYYKRFKDIVMLQKIFNHTSPWVTLRYIGIEQTQIEKSYLRFIL